MDQPPTRLSDLSPEELDRLARAHVDGLFDEVRGTARHMRTEWHPVKLAARHPLATTAIVGVAGLAAAQLLRRRRRGARAGAGPELMRAAESIGCTVGQTLLTGLRVHLNTLPPAAAMAVAAAVQAHVWA
jgi:hypothetical protein